LPQPAPISTLSRHERFHFPAISTAIDYRQTHPARRQPRGHCRESFTKTATHYSQQVEAASTQLDRPGSHRPWLPIDIPKPSTPGQVSYHHQTVYPAPFPQCPEEAEVSPSVFTSGWPKARPKGPFQRGHQSHCPDEAKESSIWLPSHCPTAQPDFRPRSGQRHRPACARCPLQTRSR
jgi:hypothetical protein